MEEEREEKRNFKESLVEILTIIKVCLTSFWFWLPSIFAIYMLLQLYLMLLNPLFLLIVPAVLAIYAILWEEKRAKARYGIKDAKVLRASHPLFSPPQKARTENEVDQLVEEYKEMLKKRKRK